MPVGELSSANDPETIAVGGGGLAFDVENVNGLGRLEFSFEASSVRFVYGGGFGDITVTARNAAGAIVDSFHQASTFRMEPAGPVVLNGAGIRSIHWQDTIGNSAFLDNLEITVPHSVYLGADTEATGSLLESRALVTSYGYVELSNSAEILSVTDPDALSAGAFGKGFDVGGPNPGTGQLDFSFEVNSVRLTYGGNVGGIRIEARDLAGDVIDSFFQPNTSTGEFAGPITLSGGPIRTIHWAETTGSYAILDEIHLEVVPSVLLDADELSTGRGLPFAPLYTPYGPVSFPRGELSPGNDTEMVAAGRSFGEPTQRRSPTPTLFGWDGSW